MSTEAVVIEWEPFVMQPIMLYTHTNTREGGFFTVFLHTFLPRDLYFSLL